MQGKVLKACMQERGRTKENEHMLEGLNCSFFLCELPTRGGQKEVMTENVCRELLLKF
jgi:hypothetical protein